MVVKKLFSKATPVVIAGAEKKYCSHHQRNNMWSALSASRAKTSNLVLFHSASNRGGSNQRRQGLAPPVFPLTQYPNLAGAHHAEANDHEITHGRLTAMSASAQTRSFDDIGSMSGLSESGHGWPVL